MSEGTPGDHKKADEEGKSQEEKEGEGKSLGTKKEETLVSELKSWTCIGDGKEEVVKSPVASSSTGAGVGSFSQSNARKYQVGLGTSGEDVDFELEEYSEDDTEVSSEAVVDDIELILMPEEVEDLPAMDHSPKLVRVTELNIDGNMEDDFFKMDADEGEEDYCGEEEEEEEEDGNGTEKEPDEQDDPQSQDYEEEDETTENGNSRPQRRVSSGDVYSSGKVHSGVQTDISALEKDDGDYDDGEDASYSEDSSRFDWRRRKTLTLTGVGIAGTGNSGKPSGRLATPRGKKLNWKSELTLLPSKTKIGFVAGSTGLSMGGSTGFGAFSFANSGYSGDANFSSHDQYSPRVAKFTSQDNVMSSSSQFLKPSTLYRTRNLSRNLNHFASSENTFMQQDQQDSHRFQVSTTALCTSTNFRGSTSQSSNQICMAAPLSARRRPSAKNFRQSLPDLSSSAISYQDNNRRRQSQLGGSRSGGGGKVNFGFRLQKKSSSDDETSSLIDESERCLRSSIDLLLTDDYPSPGCDYPYMPRSTGGGAGGLSQPYAASTASGYYSARRSCSQPLLTDQGLCGEPRDPSMGSPFLPRTLKDMRCSRWAKVILPNGLVAVVCVKEMDELRDCLTVHTETGCVVTIPFRKVVFAWRIKR
ncbi:unnamed protein product [Allacma fusca]|uniref:Uncharacterized protein n=1 Tax=Allacma fusca TaxID=39272 RepID=A0A8J2JLB6_9HEXA|nr:unnamed protein product [Allacma fusca]